MCPNTNEQNCRWSNIWWMQAKIPQWNVSKVSLTVFVHVGEHCHSAKQFCYEFWGILDDFVWIIYSNWLILACNIHQWGSYVVSKVHSKLSTFRPNRYMHIYSNINKENSRSTLLKWVIAPAVFTVCSSSRISSVSLHMFIYVVCFASYAKRYLRREVQFFSRN